MVRPKARRLTAVIVAGLAAASLGACQSDDGAAASASQSPSAKPTAEPSPRASRVVVAPQRPAAMEDDGPAGAEAAAKYFIELDPYMQATGDTSGWEALSHAECGFCAERLSQARSIKANGQRFEGGEARVEVIHTYAQDATTGAWPVEVRVHQEATAVTDIAGNVVFTENRNVFTATVGVGRRDDGWVIAGIGYITKE